MLLHVFGLIQFYLTHCASAVRESKKLVRAAPTGAGDGLRPLRVVRSLTSPGTLPTTALPADFTTAGRAPYVFAPVTGVGSPLGPLGVGNLETGGYAKPPPVGAKPPPPRERVSPLP